MRHEQCGLVLQVSLARTFGSLCNVLQNLLLKRQVGHQLLQPAVLLLQLLELPGLLDVQTTVFLPVSVVALLSQTSFLAGPATLLPWLCSTSTCCSFVTI